VLIGFFTLYLIHCFFRFLHCSFAVIRKLIGVLAPLGYRVFRAFIGVFYDSFMTHFFPSNFLQISCRGIVYFWVFMVFFPPRFPLIYPSFFSFNASNYCDQFRTDLSFFSRAFTVQIPCIFVGQISDKFPTLPFNFA